MQFLNNNPFNKIYPVDSSSGSFDIHKKALSLSNHLGIVGALKDTPIPI